MSFIDLLFYGDEQLIYETTNLSIRNNIELLERITSLLYYYLISTYQRKIERCVLTTYVDVYFPCSEENIRFKKFFKNGYGYDNPLTSIKEYIKDLNEMGYILSFTNPFDLFIQLKTEYIHGREYERIETEEADELQINAIKSFKSEECIICLTNSSFYFLIADIYVYAINVMEQIR